LPRRLVHHSFSDGGSLGEGGSIIATASFPAISNHFQPIPATPLPPIKLPNVLAVWASNHCLFVYMALDIVVFADYSGALVCRPKSSWKKTFYFTVSWAMFCGLC
jgi:hypothetical protein